MLFFIHSRSDQERDSHGAAGAGFVAEWPMALADHFALPPQATVLLRKLFAIDPATRKPLFNLSKSLLFCGPPKVGKTLLMKTLLFMLSGFLIARAEADGRLADGHAEADSRHCIECGALAFLIVWSSGRLLWCCRRGRAQLAFRHGQASSL